MLTISLRDFQLKPTEYLNKLPLTLTRYGKPITIVNTYKESVDTSNEVGQNEKKISTVSPKIEIEEKPLYKQKNGWCQNHFGKGEEYVLTHAKYYDHDDNLILDKWICDDCFINLVDEEKTVGGKLEFELINNKWGE